MEDRNRSGSHSGGGGGGGVVKNRSSSGCLIIKKKPDGVGGVGSSSSGGRKVYESKKEKKRARLMGSDSVSSDEELLEFYRRRGGGGGGEVPVLNEVAARAAPLVYKRGVGNHGEFSSKIDDFDDVGFGRNAFMREGGFSRSSLDVYDFDEYDDLSDVDRIGMRRFYENRFLSPRMGMKSGSGVEFESGSSKGDITYKRRNSFNGSMSGEKIKGSDRCSVKRRFEVKNELPIPMGKEKIGGSNEAIRLQGKNGVLKVMVKHKKEDTSQVKPRNYMQVEGNKTLRRCQEITSKNVVIRPSPYPERKLQKKPMVIGRVEKDQQRKRKSLSVKSSEESDEESEDSDQSPKVQPDMGVHRPFKRGRSGESLQSPERAQPTKLKEGKVKRGSGTEKQLLREKIRTMLVNAGWTIDYRPRRGRDYFDAVYVNPAGTAYWSIIKAYDALQKQLEEEGNVLKPGDDCSSFAPIGEDTLSKLTRQTRKKIEKELKRKKREEAGGKRKKERTRRNFEEDDSDTDSKARGRHDERLSSFMKRSGKSVKSASKEAHFRDGGSPNRGQRSSSMSNSTFIHGRKSKKIGRCTLLVRSSEKGLHSDSDGFVPYTGKRNLLSWLIDSGTVKLTEKVHYMNRRRTRVMLEGWLTRDGIHCGCCSKILTISKFEIHAASKLRQPFQNIYLSSGLSLLECQVDAWNRQDEAQRNGFCEIDVDGDDPNDDTCAICGDGGNLICCDGCPSTFHQNCLDIRMLPPGDWHCPHCSCKYCGLADVSLIEGNDTRKDTILTCSLCEGKYHSSCMEEMGDTPVNSNIPVSFCGKRCQELFEHLQKLLGVKHELEAGLCWSLIHRTDIDSDTSSRGYPQRVEWNSKLAVALTVVDECFLPITDRRSGINMIHNVLYNCGSNFTRLNYSGFYTAVLERGDEIVSAASIRIRGTQFAEMPFIGTRHIYRRQGMCRRLFSAIESALRSMKIEKLIIPAISELMETWTGVFGFSALEDKDKQEMKTLNMLAFPGTDMLIKKLLDQDGMKRDSGIDLLEVGHCASVVPDLTNNCDLDASPGPSSAAAVPDSNRINEKSDMDFRCRDAVCFAEETSPRNTSGDIGNEVKPSVLIDEGQGTLSSTWELDTNLNESISDVKVQGFPDSSADLEIGKFLNTSPEKHDLEASMDSKLKQEASETDGVTRVPLADESIARNAEALITSPHSTSGDVCNEVEASLHSAAADVCNEAKPPVSSEEGQGNMSSISQLDTKLKESVSDVTEQIFSDSCADNHEIGKFLNNSPEKYSMEATTDCKLKQDGEANARIGLPPADKSVADNPDVLITSPHSASGDVCDEVKPPVLSEEGQGNVSSTLQLDTKLNESVSDLTEQNFPDSSAGIHEVGDFSNNSAEKSDLEATTDFKLKQEASKADPGRVLPLADISITSNPDALVTSPHSACGDVRNEVEPSLHCARPTDVANEVKSPSSSVEGQGNRSSTFPLDPKLNESSVDVNVQNFPDSSVDIYESGKLSSNSPAKHDTEASKDCKLKQEASEADAGTGLPPADTSIAGNPDALLKNAIGIDDGDLAAGILCSKSGPAADRKHQSSFHDDGGVKMPMIASQAEDIQDSSEVEITGASEVPNADNVCSSSKTTELLTMLGDGMHISPQNVGEGAVGIETPQTESCDEDTKQQNLEDEVHHADGISVRVSSDQSVSNSCDVFAQNVRTIGVEKPQQDSSDVGSHQEILEGEVCHAQGIPVEVASVQPVTNICCEVSENIGSVGAEETQLDHCAVDGNQSKLEGEIHHADDVEGAIVQQLSDFSFEISAQNEGAVGEEKPQLDSCGDSSQTTLEGEVLHAHEISASGQPVSDISSEISAQNELAVGQEKPQLDTNKAILEGEVSHAHDISASLQVTSDFSSEISAQNEGAVGQEKPQLDSNQAISEGEVPHAGDISASVQPVSDFSSEISAKNEGGVGQEKSQLDSNQALVDNEVHDAHDISLEVANAQPVSNVEPSAHSGANLSSPSTDGGHGKTIPFSDCDDM